MKKVKKMALGGPSNSRFGSTKTAPPPARAKAVPAPTKIAMPQRPMQPPASVTPAANPPGMGGLGGLGKKGPVPGLPPNMLRGPITLPPGVSGDTFTPSTNRPPTNLGGMLQGLQKLGSAPPMKKGGAVKAYAKGGKVSSASNRGDGIALRGKTKGRSI